MEATPTGNVPDPRRWWALVLLCGAFLMVLLEDYLAANAGANPLALLNEGFQSAFPAVVVLAGIGMALALLLPGRPRKAPHDRLEPVPATGAADLGEGRVPRTTIDLGKRRRRRRRTRLHAQARPT